METMAAHLAPPPLLQRLAVVVAVVPTVVDPVADLVLLVDR